MPAPSSGPSDTVEVRQALASDRPALAEFIREAYGDRARYKDERRWTWQFVDNPFGDRSDGRLPVWIALDGGRVVGQIALQEAQLQVEDSTLESGWLLDVMVLPSYRSRGLGHRMHDALVRDRAILVTLTMAEATRRMGERAGCITLGDVHQLTRWVRLDAATVRRYVLARTINHPSVHSFARWACALQLHRLVPVLANPLLRLRDSLRKPAPRSTEIVEIEEFGADVDALWERTRGDYPVIFPRDTRYLNWRFVGVPDLHYRRFVARRGDETVGYVVLRRAEPEELPQGVIVDLYAGRSDTAAIEDLVQHGLDLFGTDVAAVDCATSIPELETVYRRHGFFRTRTAHPTCVCRDASLRQRLDELTEDWFFSKGDHDWDQIHVVGHDS